jgi:hypothetical protein
MSRTGTCSLVLALAAVSWAPSAVATQAPGKGEKKRQPKFTLGKETTYVKGPLTKDGYVDYVTALNQRLSKGVTPENNANVLLWKAFGPHPERSTMPPEFFKWLGMPAPPERGQYCIGRGQYVAEHLKLETRKEANEVYAQLKRAKLRPWTAKQYPHVASWLKANEKPLSLTLEAARRSHYFLPRVPKGDDGLSGTVLPSISTCRELANALAARAMLRVGEGRYDEAWQDLLTCHRLGRLVARGGFFIEVVVGITIDMGARRADLAYLERAKLSTQQLKDRLRDLERLPPLPAGADTVDFGERCLFLDTLMTVVRDGPRALERLSRLANFEFEPVKPRPIEPAVKRAFEQVDWDRALRNANQLYDRMAAAMRLKGRAERAKRLDRILGEVKGLKAKALTVEELGKLLSGPGQTPETRGKLIGDFLLSLPSAVPNVSIAWDRQEQTQRNLHLAFALAAYRKDHGRYPAKLEALAPKYLPQVPQDLFSGKGLIYRPTEKGYLLYSVGPNGKDEQGRSWDSNPPGDDVAVRMPLPELRRK